jgi:hypothetical protein
LPSFLFGFDFTGELRAAHTKRPIGRIELVGAVILGARDKSESTAGRLHNDLAFITDGIIHELVEHHLRPRPNRQIGAVDKNQVRLASISGANRLARLQLATGCKRLKNRPDAAFCTGCY